MAAYVVTTANESQVKADIEMLLKVEVHVGTINCKPQITRYVLNRRKDGTCVINIVKTWERLQMAARMIASVKAIDGRHTPGTLSNKQQPYYLLIVTAPLINRESVKETALKKLPIIAFCDTDSPSRLVGTCIPTNNKGKHSIACLFWLFARMILIYRGTIHQDQKRDVMGDVEFPIRPDDTVPKLEERGFQKFPNNATEESYTESSYDYLW
ncbi:unnamed protein product [Arabis nemorensis]|uniref:40S ribosomal protein SA n=1 Tax=Arabis nemorensis TaxID=586526 RepID=A0A565BDM6_9BRAS|nr:unnamed protein product [Arabis nemorensis]